MKVPRHILAEAIAERTLHVRDQKLLARQIAAYLLAEKRVSEIESILRDIMQYRTDQGILEAQVVTAHESNAHILADVKALLKAAYPNTKAIHLGSKTDESVVGGVRIDMAHAQLDLTVRSKLATFKRLTSQEGM